MFCSRNLWLAQLLKGCVKNSNRSIGSSVTSNGWIFSTVSFKKKCSLLKCQFFTWILRNSFQYIFCKIHNVLNNFYFIFRKLPSLLVTPVFSLIKTKFMKYLSRTCPRESGKIIWLIKENIWVFFNQKWKIIVNW